MTVSNDRWLQITDFPNYEVSDTGFVRNRTTKKLLSLSTKKGNHPYQRAHLSKDGKASYVLVHRLVLSTFVGPCPEGMQCLHKDDNPRNNNLSNLEWDTPKQNHSTINRNGVRNGRCKLSPDDVLRIRASDLRQHQLAKHYGVAGITIKHIQTHKLWKHL